MPPIPPSTHPAWSCQLPGEWGGGDPLGGLPVIQGSRHAFFPQVPSSPRHGAPPPLSQPVPLPFPLSRFPPPTFSNQAPEHGRVVTPCHSYHTLAWRGGMAAPSPASSGSPAVGGLFPLCYDTCMLPLLACLRRPGTILGPALSSRGRKVVNADADKEAAVRTRKVIRLGWGTAPTPPSSALCDRDRDKGHRGRGSGARGHH